LGQTHDRIHRNTGRCCLYAAPHDDYDNNDYDNNDYDNNVRPFIALVQ